MKVTEQHRIFSDKDWDWINQDITPGKRAVSIPRGLYFIWATIALIKDKYNIATLSGRVGLTAWWLINGVEEYPSIDITIKEDERLFEPATIPEQVDAYPVSRIALATAELNPELMRSINLSLIEDRIKLINWYYNHAVKGKRKITECESYAAINHH